MCIRPGAMYIFRSFLGCIGTLMKGSGLDVLVGAAFVSRNGIITGVAWVRAMSAFRMGLAALLQIFLRRPTGAKTCEEISVYLEEARKHPRGRYWVDNLLKSTVLTHQFIRAERERERERERGGGATGSSSSYVWNECCLTCSVLDSSTTLATSRGTC